MSTPEEKSAEIKERLESNINKVQQLRQEIQAKQEEAATLTQPIMEDQGAFKVLQDLINS